MTSADFCSITSGITPQGALRPCGRVLWLVQPFRTGPQSDSQNDTDRMPVEQISPDKDVNYCYTTAAFLVASGDYPTCLRQASLLNPGLRCVVPTCPETEPCMPFLYVGS
jgi:hypothetical protein